MMLSRKIENIFLIKTTFLKKENKQLVILQNNNETEKNPDIKPHGQR